MKTRLLCLGVFSALLVACSPVNVHVRTEPGIDFGRYKSYAFLQRPPGERVYGSLLAENELIYGIGDEMTARGIKADPASPDLLIKVQSSSEVSQQQVTVNPMIGNPWQMPMWGYYDPLFWSGRMSPWWGNRTQTQTVTQREGTIEIYIYDRASKQAVWQGAGIGDANDPFENVKRTVKKLFRKFPVKPMAQPVIKEN